MSLSGFLCRTQVPNLGHKPTVGALQHKAAAEIIGQLLNSLGTACCVCVCMVVLCVQCGVHGSVYKDWGGGGGGT